MKTINGSKVLIHCQPSLLQTVAKLEYEFHLTNNEIDVIVDDIQEKLLFKKKQYVN